MRKESINLYYHITYWLFVIISLTLVFGLSWENNIAAFYFVTMLLPIVIGTSYFFNYILVPKFFLKRKFLRFSLYTVYTVIVSLYLESIVLLFSFIYLGKFSFQRLGPNASDTILLAVVLYLLVFVGALLLMVQQIKENQVFIQKLLLENERMKKSFLEIMSNRKMIKIPYDDIVFIESLSDYVKVNTINGQFMSKEKISSVYEKLPSVFLRIHRSFIVNKDKLKRISYNEVLVGDVKLNIGRSYRKDVKQNLNKK